MMSLSLSLLGDICGNICRIIEPLASRCAKFRFKPLSEDVMTTRVLHICQEEGLELEPEVCSSWLIYCLKYSGWLIIRVLCISIRF